MTNKNLKKSIIALLIIIITSAISSFAIYFFIYPANFASIGLDGVVIMLHSLFPWFDSGLANLLLNLPLIIIAWFKLDRKYVVYVLLSTVFSSLFLSLFGILKLPQFQNSDSSIISALFAGVLLGSKAGYMYKIGGSTGGIEILANVVQKKYPFINCERIVTIVCMMLLGASYFVYNDLNCILLAIIELFVYEKVVTFILRDNREAIEVKIITSHPEDLYNDIVNELGHSATIVSSKGMYSGSQNTIVFMLISRKQIAHFIRISKKYPNTFIYYMEVQGIYGKFRMNKNEPIEERRGNE